ncbi:hypothetical protein DMH01_36005 [Amycolatopsis sp. WAC 04182]|uniref:GAF and ANTAR domain-containing protein n=1 Tax=Amycolatopsis sp. WAC 04182 TaxID=2203198 RepID=UPI000F785953|nr:GAF and ANTAR domain-containing protein [Amycolatopsis sp. WAC 04182]RSN54354.1 hypothetical protein DMH01_36005 [Amycolatopsis sp. WAC 04182]
MRTEEQDWNRDKARFVADPVSRDHGAPLGPLAQQFATLTYSLLDASTVGQVLEQVVHTAARVVPGADIVSITLRSPDGRFHTPVWTDRLADELDQLQYEYGEGPCVDAAREDGPASAVSDDLAASEAWPRFGPAAATRGAGSLLSTALVPDARPPRLSGAINIYSRRPHGLDAADQTTALLLATHASLALQHVQTVTRAELEAEQLTRAIDSRDVIGQAKGILMARRGISADEAFDLLRRTSQELNVKLVKLAETLAEHHTDLEK